MEGKRLQITDNFKCPICVEVPVGKVFQCLNGHSLCEACLQNLEFCPHCRSCYRSGIIRNRTLEAILDDVLDREIKCPHASFGCNTQLPRKDVKAHSQICMFNPQCIPFCKLMGFKCDHILNRPATEQLMQHFLESHACPVLVGSDAFLQLLYFNVAAGTCQKIPNCCRRRIWQPVVLRTNCQPGSENAWTFIVLAVIHPEDKTFSLTCYDATGQATTANELQFHAKFQIRQVGDKVIRPIQWCVPISNILDCKEGIPMAPFRIPVSLLLQHYTQPQGNLQISVEICSKRDVVEYRLDQHAAGWTKVQLIPFSELCIVPGLDNLTRFIESDARRMREGV